MKFDYYLLNSYVPETDGPAPVLYKHWLEQARTADSLGYDILWTTEHHFRSFGGMLPNPQLMLSAFAAITQRIRLGTAVSTLPLHNPIRVAEDFAMLDNLSGGRIECGFGRGMTPFEYTVFGADWEEAQEILEEAVSLLVRAWSETNFVFNGEFFHDLQPITIFPPMMQAQPRVWMTANRSPEHFAWIGEHGYNLMTLPWAFPTLEIGHDLIEIYRNALEKAGHNIDDHEILGMMPAYVDESSTTAHAIAERGWNEWRSLAQLDHPERPDPEYFSYPRMVSDSRGIFGDPKECENHVARLGEELGLSRIALVQHFGGISQQNVLNSMQLFVDEVAHI